MVEVTHRGAGPTALVAFQPAGNAGALTLSKLVNMTAELGHGVTNTVDVGVAVGGGDPSQPPWTVKTMCIFGKPIVATSVGVVIPQAAALK